MINNERIPVIGDVDIIVVGGTTAGVAIACAAAHKHSKVFLATSETYLGEDICALGRYWFDENDCEVSPLLKKILADENGDLHSPVKPLSVKLNLDTALLNSGAYFLFDSHPSDLLLDENGAASGAVFTGKSGPFAVKSKYVVDATLMAKLARSAGLPFTHWDGGKLTFKKIAAGNLTAKHACDQKRILPGVLVDESIEDSGGLQAAEYSKDIYLQAWNPAELNRAEQLMRDATWNPGQLWASDMSAVVPPVHIDGAGLKDLVSIGGVQPDTFQTSVERFYVSGPCAAVPRNTASQLMTPQFCIPAGNILGKYLSKMVHQIPDEQNQNTLISPKNTQHTLEYNVSEPVSGSRFERDCSESLPAPAGLNLPTLGTFDVVVAGGGTGGAPAAISAARKGANVLLLESLSGLGGVGTLGLIGKYYHGYREGFTAEMTEGMQKMASEAGMEDFDPASWKIEHKSEWLRKNIKDAGGQIWYNSKATGALLRNKRLQGVIVNTPWGRGVIEAKIVIDATGNADIASAAGAECKIVSEDDLAVQGSGLPPRPLDRAYFNTDYTFIDDNDQVDITRAFLAARRKYNGQFDLAQIPDTRERRQIVGDVTLTPYDVYTSTNWRDAICLSRSNFDSHGFTVHPLFFIQPPDRTSFDVWVPLRALLPKGYEGLLVTGLSLSAHRDVMPVLRMQPDVQNHAYAAGAAAAMAVKADTPLRDIDIHQLQLLLVDKGILPQHVFISKENEGMPAPPSTIQAAARGELHHHSELSILMQNPDRSIPLIRKRLVTENDAEKRVLCAKLLAFMGDETGEDILIETVDSQAWDQGWNYRGMGQFGRSMSFVDDCIVALARIKSRTANEVLLNKAAELSQEHEFSHFRAVSLYAESVKSESWAELLAELLNKDDMSGHAILAFRDALAHIPESGTDNTTRNAALRELYLARALYLCGDLDGTAKQILQSYSKDVRGHFARYADNLLRK